MDFTDYLVINDPLTFCTFLEGGGGSDDVFGFGIHSCFWFHQVLFSITESNFPIMAAFGLSNFGSRVGVLMGCLRICFLLKCITCHLFSARVYCLRLSDSSI